MAKFSWFVAVILLCLGGVLTTSAVAQDQSGGQPPSDQSQRPHRGGLDPARRTEMLTKHLGLTSDQQPKVLDALKSERSQMEALHSDSSLSHEDRHAKMMDIHKATNDQIRGILNADQQKKWDEMQSRREQWQEHRHGEQPPSQPPASPNQQ